MNKEQLAKDPELEQLTDGIQYSDYLKESFKRPDKEEYDEDKVKKYFSEEVPEQIRKLDKEIEWLENKLGEYPWN